jgi:hypothetical protein
MAADGEIDGKLAPIDLGFGSKISSMKEASFELKAKKLSGGGRNGT